MKRATLGLLAGATVKLTDHGELSRERICGRLTENDLKSWRRDMWCIAQVDGTERLLKPRRISKSR